MALNVLGSQFDKLLNVTLCYPQNSSHPFYDMLSGKLTRIVVRVNLEPVKEELHGDYVNDKGFKRRFQLWLNTLWAEKDAQIDAIKASTKKPVSDRLFRLLLAYQIFHGIGILLYKDIHAAGIHALRIHLIFAIHKHRRNPCSCRSAAAFSCCATSDFTTKLFHAAS